jgi:L-cysteine S-thiosulfotransferase
MLLRLLVLAAALFICQGAAALPAIVAPSIPTCDASGKRSGFCYMSPSTQALQSDDVENPGFLWVQQGQAQFAKDCSQCHTVASMRDVAPRYPAFDARTRKVLTLGQRIAACGQRHLKRAPGPPESEPELALQAYIAHQARGRPIMPVTDQQRQPLLTKGRTLYNARLGQMAVSCAMCHDGVAGLRLAGSTIPQAHPTGYPVYRLAWQSLGSLQRRMRGCMTGVRAEPYAYGSEEFTALELYLMNRAAGMPIESPGVRP